MSTGTFYDDKNDIYRSIDCRKPPKFNTLHQDYLIENTIDKDDTYLSTSKYCEFCGDIYKSSCDQNYRMLKQKGYIGAFSTTNPDKLSVKDIELIKESCKQIYTDIKTRKKLSDKELMLGEAVLIYDSVSSCYKLRINHHSRVSQGHSNCVLQYPNNTLDKKEIILTKGDKGHKAYINALQDSIQDCGKTIKYGKDIKPNLINPPKFSNLSQSRVKQQREKE